MNNEWHDQRVPGEWLAALDKAHSNMPRRPRYPESPECGLRLSITAEQIIATTDTAEAQAIADALEAITTFLGNLTAKGAEA